jgi:hypothetical protein
VSDSRGAIGINFLGRLKEGSFSRAYMEVLAACRTKFNLHSERKLITCIRAKLNPVRRRHFRIKNPQVKRTSTPVGFPYPHAAPSE